MGAEEVEVTLDQRALCGDGDGMAVGREDLEQAAHDAAVALDGLVGVGVGADGEHLGDVAAGRELARQGRPARRAWR
jgi:hypothetical protein